MLDVYLSISIDRARAQREARQREPARLTKVPLPACPSAPESPAPEMRGIRCREGSTEAPEGKVPFEAFAATSTVYNFVLICHRPRGCEPRGERPENVQRIVASRRVKKIKRDCNACT